MGQKSLLEPLKIKPSVSQLSQKYFSKAFLIILMITLWISGIWLGFIYDWRIGTAIFFLMISAFIYNIPPVRAKDIAFFDVIIESLNNPIMNLKGLLSVSEAGCPDVPSG